MVCEERRSYVMQFNGSGRGFEERILGVHSECFSNKGFRKLKEKFAGTRSDFPTEFRSIIKRATKACPNTTVTLSLYNNVRQVLVKKVDTDGMVFLPSVDTRADLEFFTDGFFYIPCLDPYVVTIDVFVIPTHILKKLREQWIASFPGEVYTELDFQNDLYRHNKGLTAWKRTHPGSFNYDMFVPPDIRRFDVARPENHFILTPYHLRERGGCRTFAKIIAGYFLKVSGSTKKTENKP